MSQLDPSGSFYSREPRFKFSKAVSFTFIHSALLHFIQPYKYLAIDRGDYFTLYAVYISIMTYIFKCTLQYLKIYPIVSYNILFMNCLVAVCNFTCIFMF